jgi:hypothetical protein
MIKFALFFMIPAALSALDWPSQNAVATGNFGTNNRGRPQLGDTFSATGPVMAVGEGELIFATTESSAAVSRLPSTLGAWLALDHGDGLVSIYARIEDSVIDTVPKKIEQGTVIANCGSTGWSNRDGYYLSFFDRKERRWVNPSLIITAKEDTRAPSIQSVKLKNEAGALFDMAMTRVLKQGYYGIIVQSSDTRQSSMESPLAPFKIICSVNGMETGAFSTETFSARDGVLMAYRGGLTHARQIFEPYPAVEAGYVVFTRGQVNLSIIVQDITGNTVNAQYRLFVE